MSKSTITFHRRTAAWGDPPIFRSDLDAVQWAIGQGMAERDATAAYAALHERHPVGTWARWLGLVAQLLARQEGKAGSVPVKEQ